MNVTAITPHIVRTEGGVEPESVPERDLHGPDGHAASEVAERLHYLAREVRLVTQAEHRIERELELIHHILQRIERRL